jgi:RNA 2',3'-cyclic 3'-phosphodiesterase
VRLFVAIDIPEDVRRRVADFARELRKHDSRARWARIEGAHLTLKFIGEVPAEQLDPIRRGLQPVRAAAPMEIEFRGAGFFGNDRRPRVLWVGVHAPAGLDELAAEIENRLEPLGIPRESRPFHPHITLARFDRPHNSGELRQAVNGAAQREFGSVAAREFHLYESRLRPEGSVYTRLETIVFAPEA